MKKITIFLFLICSMATPVLFAQDCVKCHTKMTPGIVNDWQLSKHSGNDVILVQIAMGPVVIPQVMLIK